MPEKRTYNWKDKWILIVEDEEPCYILLKEVLSETGVNHVYASFGSQAVDICKNNKDIELVLMDIRLPDTNGLEVTKQIKGIRKDLPVIAQTACAMHEDREMCMEAGCDDYLAKPLNKKKLLETINSNFKKS